MEKSTLNDALNKSYRYGELINGYSCEECEKNQQPKVEAIRRFHL